MPGFARDRLVARRTVEHVVRTSYRENALGQPIFDEVTEARNVYGWYPVSAEERTAAALAGRTVTELKLLVPKGNWTRDDEVIIGEQRYAVEGEVEDYTSGPFTDTSGRYVVNLRKVTD